MAHYPRYQLISQDRGVGMTQDLARFIADYVNELIACGQKVDEFAIMGAEAAYVVIQQDLVTEVRKQMEEINNA